MINPCYRDLSFPLRVACSNYGHIFAVMLKCSCSLNSLANKQSTGGSTMASKEFVNFGLHAKRSPWNAMNFYEMLGVSREEIEFDNDVITQACGRDAWLTSPHGVG